MTFKLIPVVSPQSLNLTLNCGVEVIETSKPTLLHLPGEIKKRLQQQHYLFISIATLNIRQSVELAVIQQLVDAARLLAALVHYIAFPATLAHRLGLVVRDPGPAHLVVCVFVIRR